MQNFPWLSTLQQTLSEQFAQQRLHHALLIEAGRGLGKREFVLNLAAGLLCETTGVIACGQCKSCQLFASGSHPDLFIAEEPEAKSIGVDLIRQVVSKSQTKSQLGRAKIFIIPDCEKMTEGSANALLKTLEEPGQDTYLLLTTESESRLLPTILSRCQKYKVAPPKLLDIQNWITEQGIDFTDYSDVFELVEQAPLIALELVKTDFLTQHKRFLADFKLLITGKKSAFEFSLNFDDKHYERQLDWMVNAFNQWLKAKLKQEMADANQAAKRLLLSDLTLLITTSRKQMLQSGANKKLIYQSLCLSLEQKLR